jgi:hypothetical protein
VPKDQIGDALLVLNCCCERPGGVTGEVLRQTDMLFSLLKACFFQLQESRAIGSPTGEAGQEQVAMWVCVTGALTLVLRRCLNSSPANRKKILGEMARNGGPLLCRAVFKERREPHGFFATSPVDATSSRLGHDASESPGVELLELVDELWADLAPKLELKECSNPVSLLLHLLTIRVTSTIYSEMHKWKGIQVLVLLASDHVSQRCASFNLLRDDFRFPHVSRGNDPAMQQNWRRGGFLTHSYPDAPVLRARVRF